MLLLRDIAAEVARAFNLSPHMLRGPSRRREYVIARHVAALVIKELRPSASLRQIGDAIGGRDHTTVMHAIKRAKGKIAADPLLANKVEYLRRKLANPAAVSSVAAAFRSVVP